MRLLLIALTLVLAGCGNGAGTARDEPAEPSRPATQTATPPATASARVGACEPDAAALSQAKRIGVADLGLGEAEVALTAADAACPNIVFTRAPGGTAYVELGFEPAAVRVLKVGGASVLTAREEHPRGGFQQHLYAVRAGTLRQVTHDGGPLLPFVALDTAGQPHAYADCGRSGLRLVEPVAIGKSAGTKPAWDVFATTYELVQGEAGGARTLIERGVTDSRIERAHPELFGKAWFTHCR